MKTENITNGSEPTTLPIETVEEAALKYASFDFDRYEKRCLNISEGDVHRSCRSSFKAGAAWQKQQDEKRYNTLLESHKELLEALELADNLFQNVGFTPALQRYFDFKQLATDRGKIISALTTAKQIKP